MNKNIAVSIKNFSINVCQFVTKLTCNVTCAVLYSCNIYGYVAPIENFRDRVVAYLDRFIA